MGPASPGAAFRLRPAPGYLLLDRGVGWLPCHCSVLRAAALARSSHSGRYGPARAGIAH